jgi:hypothetical protein
VHLGCGGGLPEPGVAHATGHHFRRGLTLQTWRIKGNSPRGSSNGGGDRSRARDGGRLAPTFGNINDCDRTTSKMRGLSPKFILGDS